MVLNLCANHKCNWHKKLIIQFHVDRSIVFIFRRSFIGLRTAVIELFSWLVNANCLLDIVSLCPIVRIGSESGSTKSWKSKVWAIQLISSWRWKKWIISFALGNERFSFVGFFFWLFMDSSKLHSLRFELWRIWHSGIRIESVASSLFRLGNRKLSILRGPRIYYAVIFGSLSPHTDCCKSAPVLPSFPLGCSELVSETSRRIVLLKGNRLT